MFVYHFSTVLHDVGNDHSNIYRVYTYSIIVSVIDSLCLVIMPALTF